MAAPAGHDLRRIGVEHPFIVGLAVLGEDLVHDGVRLEARRLQPGFDHAQTAIRHDGAPERRIGLQPDDHLVVAVDVAGLVGGQRGGRLGIDVQNPFADFLLEVGLQFAPDGLRPLAGSDEKALVPIVGRDVALDEIADVDGVLPSPSCETRPFGHEPSLRCSDRRR